MALSTASAAPPSIDWMCASRGVGKCAPEASPRTWTCRTRTTGRTKRAERTTTTTARSELCRGCRSFPASAFAASSEQATTMTHNKTRATMTNPIKNILPQGLVGFLFFLVFAGCGPTFDPASLINDTRVVGARIEVEGAPDRASPKPGETVNVTWLVTSPDTTPSLGWTFAVCTPATGKSSPACLQAPLVRF